MSFLHQGPGKQSLKIPLPMPLRSTTVVPIFDKFLPIHLHYIQKDLSWGGVRVRYTGNEFGVCETERGKPALDLKILKTTVTWASQLSQAPLL